MTFTLTGVSLTWVLWHLTDGIQVAETGSSGLTSVIWILEEPYVYVVLHYSILADILCLA